MMVKNLRDDQWGLVEQLLPKNFFRFGHFYFFANLFMGYINNIVMKNFSFHSTKVFISKE